MKDIYHWGDGNLVTILPAQKITENTCDKCAKATKRNMFVMTHELSMCGRTNYKLHLFETLNEAAEFRDYLIRHELSQLPLDEDFEYHYLQDEDTYKLTYEEGWAISKFSINKREIDSAMSSYTLSFKERAMMDEASVHDPQKGLYIQSYNNFNKYEDDE